MLNIRNHMYLKTFSTASVYHYLYYTYQVPVDRPMTHMHAYGTHIPTHNIAVSYLSILCHALNI